MQNDVCHMMKNPTSVGLTHAHPKYKGSSKYCEYLLLFACSTIVRSVHLSINPSFLRLDL